MAWETFGLVAAAIGALSSPVLVYRLGSRNSRASSEQARFDRQDKRMDQQDRRIAELERREHLLTDYVYELRKHIADGSPPPPPDWPQGVNR